MQKCSTAAQGWSARAAYLQNGQPKSRNLVSPSSSSSLITRGDQTINRAVALWSGIISAAPPPSSKKCTAKSKIGLLLVCLLQNCAAVLFQPSLRRSQQAPALNLDVCASAPACNWTPLLKLNWNCNSLISQQLIKHAGTQTKKKIPSVPPPPHHHHPSYTCFLLAFT